MASDVPQLTENIGLSDDTKTRKSLRSAVITENDPLKIKLKISKKDIMEPVKNSREGSVEAKVSRNHRNNNVAKSEERCIEESIDQCMKGNDDEVKMKLRSKREPDEEEQKVCENEEGKDEKKKKIEKKEDDVPCEANESSGKIVKKRGRPSKLQTEENERMEEKRRLKRSGVESKEGEVNTEDGSVARRESFCWTCHKDGSVVKCDTCPRVFHLKCVQLSKDPSKDWICPECSLVLHAEKMSTRSEAMKNLSLDQLCTLLNFAIDRMKNVPESQAFWKPVDPKEVPFYDKYVTNPMDLNLLEKNMKARMYGSPQAFLADAKWLLHNSIIFNSTQSPLTSTARFLVKICKQEMAEIENCPDCYLNAHTKKDWFVEVCRKPHILIWARLKGFPFWPAKAMSTNLKTQSVDARFFGAHDKAWVPVKECYLYSKNSPQVICKKRADLDDAFVEAESYIKKMKQKYGTFCYAPDKTPFVPEMYDKQLQSMIPTFPSNLSSQDDEKNLKMKKKRLVSEENGFADNNAPGKKGTDQGAQNRLKIKSTNSEDSPKLPEDICLVNDYVSEEKVTNEDKISPEDEVERSLEMYDTANKVGGDAVDENSTDTEEDGSIPIPEHGYSRTFGAASDEGHVSNRDSEGGCVETGGDGKEIKDRETNKGNDEGDGEPFEAEERKMEEPDSKGKSSDEKVCDSPGEAKETPRKEPENDQCIVSSTSSENIEVEVDVILDKEEAQSDSDFRIKKKRKSSEDKEEEPPKKVQGQEVLDKKLNGECSKKDDDRCVKSFTTLTINQKHKFLTEAKLLANIDEMTAMGKQKVLNELGLDASQVDIRQLAEENRQILEALNKKSHSEANSAEDVSIKSEDFEQYLMEESNQESEVMESDKEEPPVSRLGSIKVRDIQTLSENRSSYMMGKSSCEPALKIVEVESLKDMKSNRKEFRFHKKRSDDVNSKKLKLEPVIELIKLDVYDKSIQKLNRGLRLSDEVSLMMVDGEKKKSLDCADVSLKQLTGKRMDRRTRARKSMPNRTMRKENRSGDKSYADSPPTNINVISVDTENSSAQKNLLKSLCADDKKIEDDNLGKTNMKTVLITTNDKGIKNVDVTTDDDSNKKSVNGVTIESFSSLGKGSEGLKDGLSLSQQKNLTLVSNSHLILTNNGPTFITNPGNQPNLALAQNNLGQLSLVHLTNLTSGIQTNFVNLANETIGLNNSIGTIYAAPAFNAEGVCSSISATGNGPVLLTATSSTNATPCSLGGSSSATTGKGPKGTSDGGKSLSASRASSNRQSSGISVKSPASLGLVTTQSSKMPPIVAKPGEEGAGQIGTVTAELNRHSIKMAEYMRATIEDILRELSNQGSLEAKYKSLTLEMEKLQWRHQQEIMELKHNSERSLMELRTSLETEKQKCLAELRSQLEARHQKIISETKNKQWCANCGKEALFYCCWNTSYCDYPCQQQHWPGHMSRCAQLGNNVQNSNHLQSKNPSLKYLNTSYVPLISNSSGSPSIGSFVGNRSIHSVQVAKVVPKSGAQM